MRPFSTRSIFLSIAGAALLVGVSATAVSAYTDTIRFRVAPSRQWQCGAGFPTGPHAGPSKGEVRVGDEVVWRFDLRDPKDCVKVVAITRSGAENDVIPILVRLVADDGKELLNGATIHVSAVVRDWTVNFFGDSASGEPTNPAEIAQAPPPPPPPPVERKVYDVWNTGACGLTDRASFTLDAPLRLTRLDLWYNWQAQERTVAYRLDYNGQSLGQGELVRAECDPYQTAWCAARATPRVDLAPGRYTVTVARGAVCQNGGSGGAGFVRVYGE